jgi:hypothetical protein
LFQLGRRADWKATENLDKKQKYIKDDIEDRIPQVWSGKAWHVLFDNADESGLLRVGKIF